MPKTILLWPEKQESRMPPVKQTRKDSSRQGVNWHTHTHWHCISENSIWPEAGHFNHICKMSISSPSFRTGQPRHGTTHRCFARNGAGGAGCFGGCQWIRWLGERDRRRLGCRCFVFSRSAADRLMVYCIIYNINNNNNNNNNNKNNKNNIYIYIII